MHLKPTRRNVNLLQKWIDNDGYLHIWVNRIKKEDNHKFFLRDNKIHFTVYYDGEEFGTWTIEPTDDVWFERGTMSDDTYKRFMKKEDKNAVYS